jgi:phenylacetate-CoA ligase
MPLIRYDIGDVAVAGERCRCGRSLPVISQILGRVRNLARLPDGRLRYISIPSAHWLEIAPVREHRVVQRSQQTVEAELTCPVPLTDDQKQRIAAMVQRTFDYPMEVEVRQVEKIDWGRSGKREEFVRLESA